MNSAHNSDALVSATLRQWPLIVGAMLVGALVGGAYALATRTEPAWEGTATLRFIAPAAVAGAPTADTLVAMALSPSVQRSVAESLGVDPARVSGQVAAAVSPRDRTIVLIKVEAPSEGEAVVWTEALAAAAAAEALVPVQRHIDFYETKIADQELKIRTTEERVAALAAQLEELSTDVPGSERRALEELYFSNQIRLQDTRAAVAYDRFILDGQRATVTSIEQTTVEPSGGILYDSASVLRGALVGTFLGVFIAAVRARRRLAGDGGSGESAGA